MNRTRDRNKPDVFGTYSFRRVVNGVQQSSTSLTDLLQYRHADIMRDTVTPGFHRLMARGQIVMNGLSVVKVDVVENPTSGTLSWPTEKTVQYYDGLITSSRMRYYPYNSVVIDSFQHDVAQRIDQMIVDAKADAIAKIDNTPYSFMEDLAELRSTMATLGNPLSSAKRAAEKFRRKTDNRLGFYMKRKGLRRLEALARASGDAWLSSRYEFRPIMYSIRDIYLGLPKIHTKPKRMKATSRKSLSESRAGIASSSYQYINYNYALERKFDVVVKIYYTMSNPIDYRDWDLGIRLKDVPKTVWALMPYSWLVDQFVDVSRSIEAITTLMDPRLTILGACITTSDERMFDIQSVETASPGGVGTVYGGNRHTTEKYVSRSPYAPSYRDAIQPFTVGAALSDTSTLLDSAAVILQHLKFGGYTRTILVK